MLLGILIDEWLWCMPYFIADDYCQHFIVTATYSASLIDRLSIWVHHTLIDNARKFGAVIFFPFAE